ncbi:hypothetical protein HDU92_001405, partial [Lobulomyces angularis]
MDTENIKVTKLNNSNWDSWDLQLYGAALRDDLVDLLEGNEEQPVKSNATQPEIKNWEKKNRQLSSLILLTISGDQIVFIPDCSNTYEQHLSDIQTTLT